MECSREKSQVYMLVHDTVGNVKLSTKRQSSKSTEVQSYQALKGMMFKRLDCECNDKSIALQSIDDPVKFLYTTSDHLTLISNEYLEILQAVPSWNYRFEVFKTEGLLEKATIAKPSNKVQVETAKGNCIGTLKYKGRLHKKLGTYFGVEVDKPIGDSNGSYDGISHFSCKKDHGMFLSINKIIDFPGVSLPQPLKSGKAKVRKSTQEPNIQEQFHHLQIGARVTAFIEKGSKNIAKPVKGTLRYIGKPNKHDEVVAGIELDENCKNIGERFQTLYHGKKLFNCSNNERYFLTKPETLFPEDQFKPEDGDIYEPYEILTQEDVDEPISQQMNRRDNCLGSKQVNRYNSAPNSRRSNENLHRIATEHAMDEESSKLRSAKIENHSQSIESLKKDIGIDNRSFHYSHESRSDSGYLLEKKNQSGSEKRQQVDEFCRRGIDGHSSTSLPTGLRLLNGNDPTKYLDRDPDIADKKNNFVVATDVRGDHSDTIGNRLETPAVNLDSHGNQSQGASSFTQQQRSSFMSDISDLPDGVYTASVTTTENPKPDDTNEKFTSHKFKQEFAESSLQIGSMVELVIRGEAYYGVIKWRGCSDNYPQTYMAGLEMEDFIQGGTDGTFMGKRYFVCSTGRGFFCKMSQLKADQRFGQSYSLKEGNSLKDVEVIKGCVVPPDSLDFKYIGRNKGIQGHHNSCYMDTTLFAMFAFTHVFDMALNRKKRRNDIKEYDIVQSIMKEQIVNPLRQNGFVNHHSVMDLRKYLNDLGDIGGFLNEEKDPEEFVNLLFDKVLKVDHFVRLRQGGVREEASHLYQIFAEKDVKNPLPSVQYLFDLSFLTANLQLLEEPSVMILQMPRFGLQKLHKRILIEPTLDITSVLSTVTHPCIICSNEATIYCRDCACTFGWSNVFVYLCRTCCQSVHSHYKRRHHEAVKSLHTSTQSEMKYPSIYTNQHGGTQSLDSISKPVAAQPRVLMELFAVVCIKTSHYVSFAKCGSGEDETWVFFDSMADRHGGQNGYNIPEVTRMNDLKYYLHAPASEIANLDGKNDERILRLYEDASLCFYRNKNVAMYK